MLKVRIYVINPDCKASRYYGLMLCETGQVLPYAPTWRTVNGAKRWAERKGYEIAE